MWNSQPYTYCHFTFIDGQYSDSGISELSAITGDNAHYKYIQNEFNIEQASIFFIFRFFEDTKELSDSQSMSNRMANILRNCDTIYQHQAPEHSPPHSSM